MPPRARRLLMLVCAVMAAGCSPALASSTPKVPNFFVGVNLDGPVFPYTASGVDLAQQFDAMQAAGVESVRVVFDWSFAQPIKNWSGVPEWAKGAFVDQGGVPTRFDQTDTIVAMAAAHGMTVLPTIMYAAPWDVARHSPSTFGIPARPGPYAAYVADLVHRYGPRGTFWNLGYSAREPIREWQIWNEPNITTYWPAQPFPRPYAKLLKAAHDAVKKADRGAKIVLAGLPNYSWQALARLYAVKNARKLFDLVAIHPYTSKPSGVITILQRVRQVMKRNHDARKPIIADEISWTSSKGKTTHNVGLNIATTEKGQARNIAAVLPMLAKQRTRLGLAAFYYYTWAGVETPNGLTFGYAGLLKYAHGSLSKKPAFSAFTKGVLAMEHCRRKGSLATICAQPG